MNLIKKTLILSCLWAFLPVLLLGQNTKVLIIGNSVIRWNSNLCISTLNKLCVSNEKPIELSTMVRDGESVYENLCHQMNVESIDSVSFWQQGAAGYAKFQQIKDEYDWIILQGRSLEDPFIFEISTALENNSNKKNKILIFQNYTTILWNDSLTMTKMVKSRSFFEEKIKESSMIRLLPVGEVFSFIHSQNSKVELLGDGGHPSPYGSLIIAVVMFKEIFGYIPIGGLNDTFFSNTESNSVINLIKKYYEPVNFNGKN